MPNFLSHANNKLSSNNNIMPDFPPKNPIFEDKKIGWIKVNS